MISKALKISLQPILHLCCALLFQVSLCACDPILQSLIFSKDRISQIDQEFQNLSTLLKQIGQESLKKSITQTTFLELKTKWFKLYQENYLKPLDPLTPIPKWRQSLDQIAHSLKNLDTLALKTDFNAIHSQVLNLQADLIELYQPASMTLFSRGRLIRQLLSLYAHSKDMDGKGDQQLAEKLKTEWALYKSTMTTPLTTTEAIELNPDALLALSPSLVSTVAMPKLTAVEARNFQELH